MIVMPNASNCSAYLVGLPCELAAAELALDLAFGAVVLQVLGQVAARQLDGTAVGAGDHVEGAGGEVALEKMRKRLYFEESSLAHDLHIKECIA